jgi:hypothetical protein
VSNYFQLKNQIKNPELTKTLLLRNQHILQSLKVVTGDLRESLKSSRPNSPVKMLSNLFGSSTRGEGSLRRTHQSNLSFSDIPQIARPTSPRRQSHEPAKGIGQQNITHAASDALERLEETLNNYVLSLHSRKGNIVGKNLRGRANADELAVNELYNRLLEDPSDYQLAAQATVDVLFSAFEKFIKIAWQDKMGPVISRSTWSAIQSKLDCLYPGDFEEFFRSKFIEMSPQNQRALRSMVKLLASLMAGTSNDGDRGILTASFAEVLVPEGNPNEFVSVLDRLVEDIEALLSESGPGDGPNAGGSITSDTRFRVNNTGSLTSIASNTSSFRKKFGFGVLTRKGSKIQSEISEPESVSVWRTLSKSKHSDGQSSSLSKATSLHGHLKSASTDLRPGSPKRPASRDRPTVLGAFAGFETSAPLTAISEGQISGPPRKKRRSSLSDLVSLQASANNSPAFTTPRTPNRGDSPLRPQSWMNNDSPRTPSPTKQSMIPAPASAIPSPQLSRRAGSPARKENSPIRSMPRALSPPKSRPTTATSTSTIEEVTISSHTGVRTRKNTGSSSSIPTLKPTAPGLSERPSSGNVRKLPQPPGSSPEKAPALSVDKVAPLNPSNAKLRMQSPQKLRERLLSEQKAVQNADGSLQAELSKIGEEIASITRTGSRVAGHGTYSRPGSSSTTESIKALEGRLTAFATKHTTLMSSMNSKLDSYSSDLSSSLLVSEQRVKKLDELYREANAENEALYSRFNEELAKILGSVRVGNGDAEMKRRNKELEDEAARLRKENGRLKREVVGLRAQLRE